MKRWIWTLLSGVLLLTVVVGASPARTAAREVFPEVINLPAGWLPEGVVIGPGAVIYSGSRANGAIYAADLVTGLGRILVPGQPGRIAVGLSFDRRSNAIFVAGGATGHAYVYDADSGAELADYTLTTATPAFINDVIVTREAAYFTNSNRAEFYRLPLGPGGELPAADAVQAIPFSGEYQQVSGFNTNGIEATPNGDWLIVVHSSLGLLYRVDPLTGAALAIKLGDASMTNGDGILLHGNTLYVVRNRLNEIAVVELADDLLSGAVTRTITSPNFDVPTTIARLGDALYAVNARFTTPPTPETTYTIVRVRR
jgi:sugar lactone lactonase YvrE